MFALAPPQQRSSDISTIVAQLRSGDAIGALATAKHELAMFPHDCQLLSLEGVAYGDLGRSKEALSAFQAALAVCPSSLPALEGAAQIAYAEGSGDAVALLEKILAIRPEDPTSHAMLAILFSQRGDCPAALPHFAASQVLFPAKPDLLWRYGLCLGQSGRWSEAVAVYGQLEREHPSAAATCNLAVAQWKCNQFKEALATLGPLLEAGSDENALTLGSRIAEDDGNTEQAVQFLRKAILLDPSNVDNYVAFAQLAYAHKSFQVGIDMIDAGLTRLPDAAPLYVARGVLYVQLSKIEDAITDFEHAHRLDPKLSLAEDAMGLIETQQHNDAASLALFRAQAKLHPKDALLQYLLAEGLADSDESELLPAIEAAKRSVSLEPSYQPARNLLATLYLRANHPALAAKEAEIALAKDPNDESALFEEIRAKHKLGDDADVSTLTKRLELVRKQDQQRSQKVSRYLLTEK